MTPDQFEEWLEGLGGGMAPEDLEGPPFVVAPNGEKLTRAQAQSWNAYAKWVSGNDIVRLQRQEQRMGVSNLRPLPLWVQAIAVLSLGCMGTMHLIEFMFLTYILVSL
ncbi:MAG TPA: hypothetical protein VI792_03215 [Candidatus Eisenbacteria bacterium]